MFLFFLNATDALSVPECIQALIAGYAACSASAAMLPSANNAGLPDKRTAHGDKISLLFLYNLFHEVKGPQSADHHNGYIDATLYLSAPISKVALLFEGVDLGPIFRALVKLAS